MSDNNVIEISTNKNSSTMEKNENIKNDEVILIDGDSEDEKVEEKQTKEKGNEVKDDSNKLKDENEIKTTYVTEHDNEEKPVDPSTILGKRKLDETKEVFHQEAKESEVKAPAGVIIKDVAEITQKKTGLNGSASPKFDVIDIDDDDEDDSNDELDAEIKANRLKCLNTSCKSGDGLELCTESSLFTYYGIKKRSKQLICESCRNASTANFEDWVKLLKEGKPMFTGDFPIYSDVVLLEDSDEENAMDMDEEDFVLSSDSETPIKERFEDIIQKTMEKYNLDLQVEENIKIMEAELAQFELDKVKIEATLSETCRILREQEDIVYNHFLPKNMELPPIEIIDINDSENMRPQAFAHPQPVRQRGLSSAASMPAMARRPAQSGGQSAKQRPVAVKNVTQMGQNWQSFRQPSTSSSSVSSAAMDQDVVALDALPMKVPPLPPFGVLIRPKLGVGDTVYVMRNSFFTSWLRSRITEILPRNENSTETQYRIMYEVLPTKKSPPTKVTSGKFIAYSQPSAVRLPVGSRVIAIYKDDDIKAGEEFVRNFYSGIVAEAPKLNNKFRYLVFFDDGYTQYVPHDDILLVSESSKNVWEDVHPETKEFIKTYLNRYPERPMVKLSIDEVVKTEWNGKWWIARVQDIDASLVKMYFDADKRTEWIYRGSTRLGPLYIEMKAAQDRQSGKNRHASILKRQNPYVEYTQNLEDTPGYNDEEEEDDVELVSVTEQTPPSRSVARKSTNRNKTVEHKVGPIDDTIKPKAYVPQDHPGRIVKISLSDAIKPKPFRPHQCREGCVAWTGYTLEKSKELPCLQRPLKFGFQRIFYERRSKPFVVYICPCGRRIRNHDEMISYLFNTKSELSCDLFDFDPWVSCVNEFHLQKTNTSIKDLSYGKENVSIECVNYVDFSYPDFVYYMTERRAMKGVNLNLDPNFLSGCNCMDNCRDRSKCSCWRLTIEGAKRIPGLECDEDSIGYQYRRLPDRVVTGIYECNPQCKCSHTCLNRVVQFPLSVKLQLYKTLMKGWGIRCLHDIPQGSFICIYAGNLLTEQAANEGGITYGDEYLAELDYIEVIENLKADYESDVVESSEEDDESHKDKDVELSEEDFEENEIYNRRMRDEPKKSYEYDSAFKVNTKVSKDSLESNSIRDRLRAREPDKGKARSKRGSRDADSSEDDDGGSAEESRRPVQFNANIEGMEEENRKRHKSVRDYYGKDECIYIMDAKNSGNIGRFLNHSCNPNVFVQNVFVDTHDLRFPWVAFFASRFIKAGDELTWDYSYDVGSVPGKALHCYCGEPNCRRRLL